MSKYYFRVFAKRFSSYAPEMIYCEGKHLSSRNGRDYFCTGTKVYEADDDWYAGLSITEIDKDAIVMLGFPIGEKIVYEGDLIPYHFDEKILGVIKFGQYTNMNDDGHGGHFGFYVCWKGTKKDGLNRVDLGYWLKVSKVVGNIYETKK